MLHAIKLVQFLTDETGEQESIDSSAETHNPELRVSVIHTSDSRDIAKDKEDLNKVIPIKEGNH